MGGAWSKLEDTTSDQLALAGVSDAAELLHYRAMQWCSRALSDGRLPASMLGAVRGLAADADSLVAAGVWRRDGAVYLVPWDAQRTAAEVRCAREKDRVRKESVRNPRGVRTESARNPNVEGEREVERESEKENREDPPLPSVVGVQGGSSPPAADAAPPAVDAASAPEAAPKRTSGRKRAAHDLPADWTPNAEALAMATLLGVDAPWEADKMRDWAASNGARKADWDATYRNWLKTASERLRGAGGPSRPGVVRDTRPAAKVDNIQRDEITRLENLESLEDYKRRRGWL